MDYYQYTFACAPETVELLVAFLTDTAFDTFEETSEGINAFLPATADQQETEAHLAELQQQFDFTWEKTFIPGQNWNKIWESNFNPVIVENFCAVRADFHDPIPHVQHELVINPKMAFGTGHHETTYMCLAALEHLPVKDAWLLDYGCGTGILAILAARLGARAVEAVDIEEESYRNTIENAEVNQVEGIIPRCGTLEAVQGNDFDGILANINRNVILDSFPRLVQLLKPGGWILVSGILATDEEVITSAAYAQNLVKVSQNQRGNWLCILYEHQSLEAALERMSKLKAVPGAYPQIP